MNRSINSLLGRWLAALTFLGILSAANGQVNVLTQHNDNARTGANLNEAMLNTSNVNVNQFGLLVRHPLGNQAFTQPLIVANVSIGGGTHNVVYVTTINNTVYAWDADSTTQMTPYWSMNLGPQPVAKAAGCGHDPYGLDGPPVIDLASGTFYVVCLTLESGTYITRLHALDIATGAEKFGGPVRITASGFSDAQQQQRPALLLLNGVVYIAFGSHCDYTPYHAFIVGYNATTLAQVTVKNLSPGGQGAIWMSDQGPAADASGNVYVATANGVWDGTSNFGESVVKMSTDAQGVLSVADWFTPNNWSSLNSSDLDFGSTGPMLMPGTNDVLVGGKTGMLYLLNASNLGHITTSDTGALQKWQTIQNPNGCGTHHIHGSPVYWNSATNGPMIYVWGENDVGRSFKFNGTTFNTTAFASTPERAPISGCGMTGAHMSLSANGGAAGTGIVWANCVHLGDASVGTTTFGILRAFNADNMNQELWNSEMNSSRDDSARNFSRFNYPTIANGKVYLATFGSAAGGTGELCIYGLGTFAAEPTFSPAAGQYATAQSVTLSTATAGATIRYTTDGSTPSATNGTVYSAPVSISQVATLKAIAFKAGLSDSTVNTGVYDLGVKLEAESLSRTSSGASATNTTDTAASNGSWVSLHATGTNQSVTFTTTSIPAGSYQLQISYKAAERGQHSTKVDGSLIGGTIDQYSLPGYSTIGYSGPVTIGSLTFASAGTHTITLTVTGRNANSSDYQLSADYFLFNIQGSSVATPTFSPAPGVYTSAQNVTISTSTVGATIRYTIDGSTPTEANGTIYSGPVNIGTTTMLQAIAYKSGMADSAVASGNYVISTGGSQITLQATNLSPTGSGQAITSTNDTAAPGGTWVKISSTTAGQWLQFATPTIPAGTYQLSFIYRTNPTRGQHSVSIDNAVISVLPVDQYAATFSYPPAVSVGLPVIFSSAITHTIQLMVTGKNGSSTNFDVSAVQFIFTPTTPQVAAPAFSPPAGAYSTAQSVAISTSTIGATIRYTIDGSTPTETNGTVYSGPVSISTTTTLQAIAYESGMTDSVVASGAYTINPLSTVTLQATALSPTGSGQTITSTNDTNAPGGTWVKISSTAAGQFIKFTTPAIAAGTYQLSFIYRTNPTRAQHDVQIDNTTISFSPVDQYAASFGYPPAVDVGNPVIFGSTITHTIQLNATGKNASSTNFDISAVQFIFTPQ